MSNQPLCKNDIPALKRQAKAMKRDLGILHSEALDKVAHQYGYNAWSHLQSSIPERATIESAKIVLKEFFGGCREERHLQMVIVLWEHYGQNLFVNQLLADLQDKDISAIGQMYSDLKGESPHKLYDAIHQAFIARIESDHEAFQSDHEAFQKQDALNEATVETLIAEHTDQYEDGLETREQMGMLLWQLPHQTQNIILTYYFDPAGTGRSISLQHALWFYQEQQSRVDSVLLSIKILHDCLSFSADFDGPETLDKWLVTPFDPAKQDSLCPLDALVSDTAREKLDAFVRKVDEDTADSRYDAALNSWVDLWMAEPQKILPEHRHLLDNRDTAKSHFEILRESARQISFQQLEALMV